MPYYFEKSRKNMVDGQIKPNNVSNPALISALESVQRENFFPKRLQNLAYIDESVELSSGRYVLDPTIFARLVQAAGVQKTDIVLDVCCMHGYSSAILSQLAATVIGLDTDQSCITEATRQTQALGIANTIFIHQPNIAEGYARQAPYDVIVVNGAVDAVPPSLLAQLAEGGRLAVVQSAQFKTNLGRAVLVRKLQGVVSTVALFDCAAPKINLLTEKPKFVF